MWVWVWVCVYLFICLFVFCFVFCSFFFKFTKSFSHGFTQQALCYLYYASVLFNIYATHVEVNNRAEICLHKWGLNSHENLKSSTQYSSYNFPIEKVGEGVITWAIPRSKSGEDISQSPSTPG